jgi:hypothetical protein
MVRIAHRCELCDGVMTRSWPHGALTWIGDGTGWGSGDGFWACDLCHMGQDLIWWTITGAKPLVPRGHVDLWPSICRIIS